jgi:fatty acid desaturase
MTHFGGNSPRLEAGGSAQRWIATIVIVAVVVAGVLGALVFGWAGVVVAVPVGLVLVLLLGSVIGAVED